MRRRAVNIKVLKNRIFGWATILNFQQGGGGSLATTVPTPMTVYNEAKLIKQLLGVILHMHRT